jgi:hypothetical protein
LATTDSAVTPSLTIAARIPEAPAQRISSEDGVSDRPLLFIECIRFWFHFIEAISPLCQNKKLSQMATLTRLGDMATEQTVVPFNMINAFGYRGAEPPSICTPNRRRPWNF